MQPASVVADSAPPGAAPQAAPPVQRVDTSSDAAPPGAAASAAGETTAQAGGSLRLLSGAAALARLRETGDAGFVVQHVIVLSAANGRAWAERRQLAGEVLVVPVMFRRVVHHAVLSGPFETLDEARASARAQPSPNLWLRSVADMLSDVVSDEASP